MSLDSIRRDYRGDPLSETDAAPDPFAQFARWFEQASETEREPNAMALATSSPEGRPSARMVLLRGVDAGGFVFYTNYESRKAGELEGTGRAALLFFWASLERQVRIEGAVTRVDASESDAYFASRPIDSQWSAVASPQSRRVEGRAWLEAEVERVRAAYPDAVPRPASWGGYRLAPERVEFWQGRPSRLHDRLEYTLDAGGWRRTRLAP
jgi:pyridoxamine 5'-phosphate oxidase